MPAPRRRLPAALPEEHRTARCRRWLHSPTGSHASAHSKRAGPVPPVSWKLRFGISGFAEESTVDADLWEERRLGLLPTASAERRRWACRQPHTLLSQETSDVRSIRRV